jgi:cyclopropane-fatty-acyl-phospholipid synthase
MSAESTIRKLLATADVEVNGTRPWDIQVYNPALYDRVVRHTSLGLGEGYIDVWWGSEDIAELINRVTGLRLEDQLPLSWEVIKLGITSRLFNRQDRRGAKEVATTHYDLPPEFFRMMYCDDRITGSCGYWKTATNLDEAQEAKLDLVCRKLKLKPGQRVLDIGCGWGSFMGYAAEKYGVECEGVTISKEQGDYANKRYNQLPVRAHVQDYRDYEGKVDRIASMGMFEHVGTKNYRDYFKMARRCLPEDGLFVLHTIWTNTPTPHTEPYIDKYIFPNGVIPTVGQITTACHGLFAVLHLENFGAYYDRTLLAWCEGLRRHREEIVAMYGERFFRTQEFYLLACAGGFRSGNISVGQIVLSPHGVKKDVYEIDPPRLEHA